MGKFGANPEIIRAKGNEVLEESRRFAQNVDKVYQTVNEMINSDYLSPEALAMANEIQSYKDDLVKMTRIIEQYGQFCLNTSSKVIRNQETIIEGIK